MLSTAEKIYRPVSEMIVAERTWSGGAGDLVRVRPVAAPRVRSARARRVLNVLLAAVALLLLLPFMLLIALAVKLTSRGPVLYTQTRVGLDRRQGSGGNWRRRVDYGGRLFTIYKFRTMTVVQDASQVWATPGDVRVTRVGRFLRQYRLDELPQLINVLKGDMNIVGPRPEQPQIFMELRQVVERYPERQRVLPGITGWAQVNQSYDRDIEDVKRKVAFDLDYAKAVSAKRDLEIMMRTIPVVLFGKGGW